MCKAVHNVNPLQHLVNVLCCCNNNKKANKEFIYSIIVYIGQSILSILYHHWNLIFP